MSRNEQQDSAKNIIPAVEKTIRLMEALSEGARAATVAELATALGISVTTCFRILRTLLAANWIFAAPEGGYRISAGLASLFASFSNCRNLVDYIAPQIDLLSKETDLSAKISIRQGDEYVTIYATVPPSPYSLNSRVNSRFPLFLGATGSVLLSDFDPKELAAFISRVPAGNWDRPVREGLEKRLDFCRRNGYVEDMGSYRPDICALAAPLNIPPHGVVCAVTLVGMPGDFSDRGKVENCLSKLLDATEECKKILETLPHYVYTTGEGAVRPTRSR